MLGCGKGGNRRGLFCITLKYDTGGVLLRVDANLIVRIPHYFIVRAQLGTSGIHRSDKTFDSGIFGRLIDSLLLARGCAQYHCGGNQERIKLLHVRRLIC